MPGRAGVRREARRVPGFRREPDPICILLSLTPTSKFKKPGELWNRLLPELAT